MQTKKPEIDGAQRDSPTMDIQDHSNKVYIDRLFREYEILSVRRNESDARFSGIIASALAISSVAAGYVLLNPDQILVAALAPLFLLAVYCLLLGNVYTSLITMWNLRVISGHINYLNGDPILIQFERQFPESQFLSASQGSFKAKVQHFTIIVIAASILLLLVTNTWWRLRNENILFSTGLTFVYGVAILLMVLGLTGALFDLRDRFNQYLRQIEADRSNGIDKLPSGISRTTPDLSVLRQVLVRPADLIVKASPFIFGWLYAMTFLQDYSSQPSFIASYAFPGATPNWDGPADVPLWGWMLCALVYFTISDGFVQQAKLLLNDIRDIHGDGKFLPGRGRIQYATPAMKTHAIARWLIGLLLSLLIGGVWFFAAMCLITVHQLVYEFKIKPSAAKHNLGILIWLSFTGVLRTLVGIIAVTRDIPLDSSGQDNSSAILLLLLLFIAYGYTVGQLAHLWKTEAENSCKHRLNREMSSLKVESILNSLKDRPRLQSAFFWQYGRMAEFLGFTTAFMAAIAFAAVIVIENGHMESTIAWIAASIVIALCLIVILTRSRYVFPKDLEHSMQEPISTVLHVPLYAAVILFAILSLLNEFEPLIFVMMLVLANTAFMFFDPNGTYYQRDIRGVQDYGRDVLRILNMQVFGNRAMADGGYRGLHLTDVFSILFGDPHRGDKLVFHRNHESKLRSSHPEEDPVSCSQTDIVAYRNGVETKRHQKWDILRVGKIALVPEGTDVPFSQSYALHITDRNSTEE